MAVMDGILVTLTQAPSYENKKDAGDTYLVSIEKGFQNRSRRTGYRLSTERGNLTSCPRPPLRLSSDSPPPLRLSSASPPPLRLSASSASPAFPVSPVPPAPPVSPASPRIASTIAFPRPSEPPATATLAILETLQQ
ncbi:hypothetical protein BKA56DRAFT_659158 [Ilyonectria sp. MPI-CAGE-AT-0026]|nr:hypothetical protein BKA56DRAFT_659158 [Ilyonectria sp. MPI-CAGE-AT-0026]